MVTFEANQCPDHEKKLDESDCDNRDHDRDVIMQGAPRLVFLTVTIVHSDVSHSPASAFQDVFNIVVPEPQGLIVLIDPFVVGSANFVEYRGIEPIQDVVVSERRWLLLCWNNNQVLAVGKERFAIRAQAILPVESFPLPKILVETLRNLVHVRCLSMNYLTPPSPIVGGVVF